MKVIARSSNLLGKITILVMVSFVVNTAVALDGSGTQEDPWRIKSFEDFNEFTSDFYYWDDYTRLETDVNLAGQTYSKAVIAPNVFSGSYYGIPFTGVFDGNGHKIMNLTIDDGGVGNDFLGLFGCIRGAGHVMNLGVEGVYVSGHLVVGGLVGENGGRISNCYSTGDVNGYFCVGGLVASNLGTISDCYSNSYVVNSGSSLGGLVGGNSGNVSNCYSTGDVNGANDVGGLVGGIVGGRISNCYSIGNVSGEDQVGGLIGYDNGETLNCYSTGDVKGANYVGGLVGQIFGRRISNCYSFGDASGNDNVGGLVGALLHGQQIKNCYSFGDASGNDNVGGLVGRIVMGGTSNCYSIGNVSGNDNVGGLIGYDNGETLNCYSTGDVKGIVNVGGLIGYKVYICSVSFWDTDTQSHGVTESFGYHVGYSYKVEGLPTAQMQIRSTFIDAGWDFINVWNIGENQTYPYLRTYLAGDINKDGIVNFLDLSITANQWMDQQ